MKSRLSYCLIAGVLILSIFLGIFIWRNQHLKETPKFHEQTFNTPISTKYIPKNADLVFHWKINPTLMPEYIEKINKNITSQKIKFIRDSSFNLISLDYINEISEWIGNYGSFAIFDSNKNFLNDWLIVAEKQSDVNIDEKIALTVEEETTNQSSEKTNNLNISKEKIFSKKVNFNKYIYFAIDKDIILISSNKKVIRSSINQPEDYISNTKEKYKEIKFQSAINDGMFLLEISPRKILSLTEDKENTLGLNQANKLISSINFDKNQLELEGVLAYKNKTEMPSNELNNNLIDIKKAFKSFTDCILIDNPKQYFGKTSKHPYQNLIKSIIQESTASDFSKLFKIILENSKGNLIWINDKNWLILTRKSETSKTEINNLLREDDFLNSSLEFKNKNLEIWSKISTNDNDNYEIKENVEAIIEENEGRYIWSQNLSSISRFDEKIYLGKNLKQEHDIDEIHNFNDILRINIGKEKAKIILNNFYPYILFQSMLGNKLKSPQNIELSISVPNINYSDFIKFKIKLKTS